MDISLFLAKVLGLYLLIVSVIALIKKDDVHAVLSDVIGNKALLAYSGAVSLLFGLVILILNPILALNYKGLITLLGGLSVLKGIVRLGHTETAQKFNLSLLNKAYIPLFIVSGLIGAYLTYVGFGF